jgi:hypothetical protein
MMLWNMAKTGATPYIPLGRSTRSIRTIRILPGDDLPISCSLHTLALGEIRSLPFTAMSYAWGPRSPTSEILLDGHPLLIRQNLWSALMSIRERINNGTWEDCGTQDLWIDAICIDQKNVAERNQQVNLMHSIYAQAAVVLVWLGEADHEEKSHVAIEFIMSANHRLENPAIVLKELASKSLSSALLALFTRQYWKRVWIIQEFLLATDLTILCGKDTCRWSELARLYRSLGAVSLSSGPSFPGLYRLVDPILASPAGEIVSNRIAWESRHHYSLVQLVLMWPKQQCEDVRDRVFGLLGLVSLWHSESPVLADYSKTIIQIYEDVLKEAGPHYGSIDARMGLTISLTDILGLNVDTMDDQEKGRWRAANYEFHYWPLS